MHDLKFNLKVVYWNAQGANSKRSMIQHTVVTDDIDVVMLQDTRFKVRDDGLPPNRISGYVTYHRPLSVN